MFSAGRAIAVSDGATNSRSWENKSSTFTATVWKHPPALQCICWRAWASSWTNSSTTNLHFFMLLMCTHSAVLEKHAVCFFLVNYKILFSIITYYGNFYNPGNSWKVLTNCLKYSAATILQLFYPCGLSCENCLGKRAIKCFACLVQKQERKQSFSGSMGKK